jgi:hypothetical protein
VDVGSTSKQNSAIRLGTSKNTLLEFDPIFSEEAGNVSHDFQLLNDTDQPIKIRQITHSCGCSTTELDTMALQPGEQTVLHVRANLKGKSGEQNLLCRLIADSGSSWEFVIRINVLDRAGFSMMSQSQLKVANGS